MILKKVIPTPKADILVIGGFKEPVYFLGIDNGIIWFNGCGVSNAPAGEWECLGFLKDIQEDVAKDIVSIYDYPMQYTNYNGAFPFCFETATESLNSLIESNCKLKNKYGEAPKYEDFGSFRRFYEMFVLWKAEQSYVFTNPYLLKKI